MRSHGTWLWPYTILHVAVVTDIFFFIRDDRLFATRWNFHFFFTVTTISTLINITVLIPLKQFVQHFLIIYTHLLARTWHNVFSQKLEPRTAIKHSAPSCYIHSPVTRRSSKHNIQICTADSLYLQRWIDSMNDV